MNDVLLFFVLTICFLATSFAQDAIGKLGKGAMYPFLGFIFGIAVYVYVGSFDHPLKLYLGSMIASVALYAIIRFANSDYSPKIMIRLVQLDKHQLDFLETWVKDLSRAQKQDWDELPKLYEGYARKTYVVGPDKIEASVRILTPQFEELRKDLSHLKDDNRRINSIGSFIMELERTIPGFIKHCQEQKNKEKA